MPPHDKETGYTPREGATSKDQAPPPPPQDTGGDSPRTSMRLKRALDEAKVRFYTAQADLAELNLAREQLRLVRDEDDHVLRTLLYPLEFMSRFTTQEKRAIETAASTSDDVFETREAFRASVQIDLESSLTTQGLDVLVTAEIISEERKEELLEPIEE